MTSAHLELFWHTQPKALAFNCNSNYADITDDADNAMIIDLLS